MHVVTNALVFLLAVIVSGFVARLLSMRVPLPLLQIAIGASLPYLGFDVDFDSHLFLLLFIPPLLFLDGWRIPKGAFFRDWRPILALSIDLVVCTVAGMGFLIHWLVPGMPLAVAFALAAILAPTDPVAVSAITANSPLPSRLMHILEGESLLNDATGLVCFGFAVTAAMTGTFSPGSALASFAMVTCGGVLVGVAVTWAIGRFNTLLVRRAGEEPGIQILISLLIPFAAYLAAERVHVSGILAAAVAGIAMHYSELSDRPLPATRIQRMAVWDNVQTALNGVIFVLLGSQLPRILRSLPDAAAAAGTGGPWHLAGYAVLITLGLGALRFAWVWIAMLLTLFRASRRGEARPMPQRGLLAVAAVAGVRGAITLAGILTLPILMPDGSAFPARDAAIFLAMGVIVLSLLIASVGLPLLTRVLTGIPEPVPGGGEGNARIAAAEAAIRRIEALLARPPEDLAATEVRARAAMHLLELYRRRLVYGNPGGEGAAAMRQLNDIERRLFLEALDAERDELYQLLRMHNLDDDLHRRLVREIDLMEEGMTRTDAH